MLRNTCGRGAESKNRGRLPVHLADRCEDEGKVQDSAVKPNQHNPRIGIYIGQQRGDRRNRSRVSPVRSLYRESSAITSTTVDIIWLRFGGDVTPKNDEPLTAGLGS